MDAADADLQAEVERLYKPGDLKKLNAGVVSIGGAGVFGELNCYETLFAALDLGSRDRFVDLGSGRGNVVLAATLRTAGPAPEFSRGVELMDNRHEAAQAAWERLPAAARARSGLACGDALREDVSAATKIFMCNATFGDELNAAFASSLSPSRAPALQRLATLAELPAASLEAEGLVLSRVTAATTSWAPSGTPLYVYARAAAPGTPEKRAPVVEESVGTMLEARRRADLAALEQADAERRGETERGLMRTALMAAAFGSG